MKLPLLCSLPLLVAGCQAMPDLTDTTPPTTRFRIHYQSPGLSTPHIEVTATASRQAHQCVYVNEPFGVVSNVADPGGIQSIIIGPSQALGAVSARTQSGDILAIPGPAEPTITLSGHTFPNPGKLPGSANVMIKFSTAKAYSTVTLMSVYTFNGTTQAAMRSTARNFGPSSGVSEVYHFHVRKAEPGDPARQAGMSCPIPPGG